MRMDSETKASLVGPADLATEQIAIVASVMAVLFIMAAFVISAHPKSAAAAALSHFA